MYAVNTKRDERARVREQRVLDRDDGVAGRGVDAPDDGVGCVGDEDEASVVGKGGYAVREADFGES